MTGEMFKLRRPCKRCPFRRDVPGYLRRARAVEIAQSIAGGAIFPCHETTVEGFDDEDETTLVEGPDSQFCAGALIVMEKQEAPNQAMRMAENLGLYDAAKLDLDAPVVGSFVEFVAHHDEEPEVEIDEEAPDTTCSVANVGCEAPAGYLMGGMAVPAEDGGEVHTCPSCGESVCDSCSDDEGVCADCVEETQRFAERRDERRETTA